MANQPNRDPALAAAQARVDELDRSCRRMIRELDEKSEQLMILNGVLRLLAADMEIKDVLQVFANNLKTLCPYDQISIALLDPETKEFLIPFLLKVGRVIVNKDTDRTISDDSLHKILESRQPVLRRNLRPEELHVKGDTTFVRRAMACEIIVPLNLGERRYGLLNVSCFDPEALKEQHLRILSDLAPAVAVAVHEFLVRNRGKIPYAENPEE